MYIHIFPNLITVETNIQKWGNSLGVRIPAKLIEKTSFRDGSCVILIQKKDSIVIKSCTGVKPKLKELVAKINSKNIHKEIDWNKPYGKEIW